MRLVSKTLLDWNFALVMVCMTSRMEIGTCVIM
jgi:hypothetical protein